MRLLVIRMSAMGDVALTAPVLAGIRKQHPDIEITLVTQKNFLPFFVSVPGIRFFCPDLKGRHKGFTGLLSLFRDVRSEIKPNKIIDLHDVLRSRILRMLFIASGIPAYVIDKGRREKRSLITGKKKVFLKHTVERYADVFTRSGYPVTPDKSAAIIPLDEEARLIEPLLGKDRMNIGVAPFAKHRLKMWPEEYMLKLLSLISEEHKCSFFLFGGKEDLPRMEVFGNKAEGITPVAGKLSLSAELALISRLDLMIAMDSSNMHLAALCGTKVISIWGGTDPMAGFGAWTQPDSYAIRIPVEELDCRPCTIYGKGTSRRDMECMKRLTPEHVFKRMKALDVFRSK